MVSIVAADALVLKHQAITNHNTDPMALLLTTITKVEWMVTMTNKHCGLSIYDNEMLIIRRIIYKYFCDGINVENLPYISCVLLYCLKLLISIINSLCYSQSNHRVKFKLRKWSILSTAVPKIDLLGSYWKLSKLTSDQCDYIQSSLCGTHFQLS